MPALSKFLVLLALFLSASHSNAFTSLSSVAGNQVRVNHLTRLQQPMSNPTNEPSREPICEPTKRMDLNAVLPVNLSSKGGLCHDKKSERVMFSNHGMIMRSRANMWLHLVLDDQHTLSDISYFVQLTVQKIGTALLSVTTPSTGSFTFPASSFVHD